MREMNTRLLPTIAFIAFHLLLPVNALGDEFADRASIQAGIYGLLRGGKIFGDEQFPRVEGIRFRFHQTRSRTASGIWQLTLFYEGVSWAVGATPDNPDIQQATERIVTEWLDRFPETPTPHFAYAKMLLNRAWKIRGEKLAHEVKPENWKPFLEHVQRARAHLETHKDVASQDPYWYELMAEIARLQQWPEAEFIRMVSEGFRREPLFYGTYLAAVEYYFPKWGGSAAAIEKFARAALANTETSEGFGVYTRIYWYAWENQYSGRLFIESQADWPTMKKGIDDILQKYPDSWNVNNFAKFACMAKDKAKTAELMARIGDAPIRSAWDAKIRLVPGRELSLYHECKKWAFGFER